MVVDVDPEFDNTDEWHESIPAELRGQGPTFYHLLLKIQTVTTPPVSTKPLPDYENGPIGHPDVDEMMALTESAIFCGQRHLTKLIN